MQLVEVVENLSYFNREAPAYKNMLRTSTCLECEQIGLLPVYSDVLAVSIWASLWSNNLAHLS